MTLPASGQIGVNDVNTEVGLAPTYSSSLNFLNGTIKPAQRPASPAMDAFYSKAYYQKNNDGNCSNANAGNCNCNCGNVNCSQTANCTGVNCTNCDTQNWLQTNCNCACTYNCTSDQNCYSYNCNCSKIICTKLYQIGLLPRDIFEADQAFGDQLAISYPDVYNGYIAWAEIVVDWMDGRGPKMMPWMSDEKFAQAAKKWSTRWAQDIATPWAEEMAYQMKESMLPNNTGKAIMAIGTPICKIVGVWQRVVGPSRRPAGFIKGAMLIPVFVLLKLVAELGRLIEGKKP